MIVWDVEEVGDLWCGQGKIPDLSPNDSMIVWDIEEVGDLWGGRGNISVG